MPLLKTGQSTVAKSWQQTIAERIKAGTVLPLLGNEISNDLVLGGSFKMGSNIINTEQPVHQVYLDEFYIDQCEVTNAKFATFLREQGNQQEGGVPWLAQESSRLLGTGQEWQVAGDYDKHPVTGASWYGAKAYQRYLASIPAGRFVPRAGAVASRITEGTEAQNDKK